jgi:hypothetical protein
MIASIPSTHPSLVTPTLTLYLNPKSISL